MKARMRAAAADRRDDAAASREIGDARMIEATAVCCGPNLKRLLGESPLSLPHYRPRLLVRSGSVGWVEDAPPPVFLDGPTAVLA